jgi:hypothetical protein
VGRGHSYRMAGGRGTMGPYRARLCDCWSCSSLWGNNMTERLLYDYMSAGDGVMGMLRREMPSFPRFANLRETLFAISIKSIRYIDCVNSLPSIPFATTLTHRQSACRSASEPGLPRQTHDAGREPHTSLPSITL